jgi:hypothetical protein
MRVNLPKWIRVAVYVLNIIAGPAVIYLLDKGLIGADEVKLWAAEVTAMATLAGLNVPEPRE